MTNDCPHGNQSEVVTRDATERAEDLYLTPVLVTNYAAHRLEDARNQMIAAIQARGCDAQPTFSDIILLSLEAGGEVTRLEGVIRLLSALLAGFGVTYDDAR